MAWPSSHSTTPLINRALAALAFFLVAFFVWPHPNGLAQTTSPREIIISHSSSMPPWSFLDDKNNPQGIIIDYWRLWATKAGVRVRFNLTEWSQAVQDVRSGQADVLGATFDSGTKYGALNFSQETLPMNICLYLSNDIKASDMVHLKGVEIGVVLDEYSVDYLRKNYPFLKMRRFPNDQAMYRALTKGVLPGFVRDQAAANYELARLGLTGNYRIFYELFSGKLKAGIPENNPDLLALINTGIGKITHAEAEAVMHKWGLSFPASIAPVLLKPLAIAGAAVVLVFLVINIVLLRIQVRRRTAELLTAFDLASYQKEKLEKELSQRQTTEEELRDSEERYRVLAETAGDVIGATDLSGRLTYMNKAGLELSEQRLEDVVGKHVREYLPVDQAREVGRYLDGRANLKNIIKLREITFRTRSGKEIPMEIRASVLRKGIQPSGILFIARDITGRKETEMRLRHMANHDQLTGLPNRRLLFEVVSQAIARAERNKKSLSLLLINLDDFKPVNDVFGQEVGDTVLVAVADRLSAALRASDCLARLGGDKFALVVEGIEATANVDQVAQKVMAAVTKTIRVGYRDVNLGISIGAAIYPLHADNPDSLFAKSEKAMQQARKDPGCSMIMATNAIDVGTS